MYSYVARSSYVVVEVQCTGEGETGFGHESSGFGRHAVTCHFSLLYKILNFTSRNLILTILLSTLKSLP